MKIVPFIPFIILLALAAVLAPSSSALAVEASPYGINIHAPQGEELTFLLDQVQAAGIGWVRIDFIWAFVEPPAGTSMTGGSTTRIVAAAQARGIEVFATLAYTPAWATDGPELTGVPRDPHEWAALLLPRRAALPRQASAPGGCGTSPTCRSSGPAAAQQYIDVILKPGADAIHAGNPDAQVAGPDLAHLTSHGADWYYWLRDTLQNAGDKLDVVTHHLYDNDGNRDVTDKLDRLAPCSATARILWGSVAAVACARC